MRRIEEALRACDLFVSIGTSGAVYPAAGFVQMARGLDKETLELNLEASQGSHFFDECRLGPAISVSRRVRAIWAGLGFTVLIAARRKL